MLVGRRSNNALGLFMDGPSGRSTHPLVPRKPNMGSGMPLLRADVLGRRSQGLLLIHSGHALSPNSAS